MDIQEATKIVMSRIQSLDHENATKIMGYILIQDQGEKEMVRLAFVADALLLSYINQAKLCLGLTSNNNHPSSNPSARPSNSFPQTTSSPRIVVPNNGFSPFSRSSPRQPISYASVLNGSSSSRLESSSFFGPGSPSLQPYELKDEFSGENGGGKSGDGAFFDESAVDPVMSPSGGSDSAIFPYGGEEHAQSVLHRRSCSVNDAAFLSGFEEDFGFGLRPCMYFARGNCRNGSACKFSHSDLLGEGAESGPGFDDLLRVKAIQQRLALMGSSAGQNPFSYNKCMKFSRNDFSPMGLLGGAWSSSATQIYLTFPADCTFREEDVSNYFSLFGPVQDVRIPYQQKRMFGFVTFAYPETVKLILAKGNPHFVCDSRVLVKPYKEKGKILEKKNHQHHQQQLENSRELCDLPVGPRMLLNSQEVMMRRKFEQEAELQHTMERKMIMNVHLNSNQQQNNFHGLPAFSSLRPSPLPMSNQEEFEAREDDAEYTTNHIESLEHALPDNLFASPTKSAVEQKSLFLHTSNDNSNSELKVVGV